MNVRSSGTRPLGIPANGPALVHNPTSDTMIAAQSLWVDVNTARIVKSFASNGIRAILMKGPVFANKLYGEGTPRAYGDSDLLVASDDFARCEAILQEMGFWNQLRPLAHPRMDARDWLREDGASVDLHFTLWGVGAAPTLLWDEFSSRTETQLVGGAELEVLGSVPCAIQAALHAAHHGRPSKAITDLSRALNAFDAATWTEAGRLARRLKSTGAFATGLRLVPGGRELLEQLGLADAGSLEALLRVRPVPMSQGIEELRQAHGVAAKTRLLLREAFPSRAFMRWWISLARRGSIGLAASYLWRLLWLGIHAGPGFLAWRRARRETQILGASSASGGRAARHFRTVSAARRSRPAEHGSRSAGSTLLAEGNGVPLGLSRLTAADEHRLAKERDFHDALAANVNPESLTDVQMDHLDRALFERLGSVSGLDVLDLGCGKGDLTLGLLARGARVTALDISPGMVEVTRRRAHAIFPGSAVQTVVGPVEAMPLADSSFDLVIGKWIIHHLDVGDAAREVKRILRPGGSGVFIENSGTNPVLDLARRYLAGRLGLPRFGTEDEHPLVKNDYAVLRRHFEHLGLYFPDFCFLQLFDRQVFRFRSRRVTRGMRYLDAWIWRRLPQLRRYSFHVIVEVERG